MTEGIRPGTVHWQAQVSVCTNIADQHVITSCAEDQTGHKELRHYGYGLRVDIGAAAGSVMCKSRPLPLMAK